MTNIQSDWQSLAQYTENRSVILACDLGGTKLACGLFEVSGNAENRSLSETPIITFSHATPRGKPALHTTFLACITQALEYCITHQYRLLPHITMGSPGRFIGQKQSQIAPGSCVNLGNTPDEFDNLDMVDFFKVGLPDFVQLTIKNDAIAQMSAGLYFLQKDSKINPLFLNQKLAYIGPGTGLGGGFCHVDAQGAAHYYSDGHIYDILIADEHNKWAGAQDLFSGVAFQKRTGYSAAEVNASDTLRQQFEPDIRLMGQFLGKIIAAIYTGNIQKTTSDAQWPESDIQMAINTRYFLIGGSMGTKGMMGTIIQSSAMSYLEKLGIQQVQLFSIPDSQYAGLLGAGHFLSRNDLNKAWIFN